MIRHLILSALLPAACLAAAAGGAAAQQNPAGMGTAVKLPDACQKQALAGPGGNDMSGMTDQMSKNMQQAMQGMMGQLNDTQKALHQAMMHMGPAMMQGALAKDADVAWICAMIPHHQGAIDMARAGLQGADNEESRRLAEETIATEEREVARLTAWVDKNAERESREDATGSTK